MTITKEMPITCDKLDGQIKTSGIDNNKYQAEFQEENAYLHRFSDIKENLGFSVFTIGNNKKPTIAWKKYQTEFATAEELKSWNNSKHSIGIATGKLSGVFVVDIDVGERLEKDGTKTIKVGDNTFADLENKYGKVPKTVEARSINGGRHLYFKYPEHHNIRNLSSKDGFGNSLPDIDIRGEGGYIVVPPSQINGKSYEWVFSPYEYEIKEAPHWILNLINKGNTMNKQYVMTIVDNEISNLTNTPEGSRNGELNKTSFKLGTFLHTGHISRNEIEQKLITAGKSIGLENDEILKTIQSGLDAGEANPSYNKNANEYIPEEPFPLIVETPLANSFPVASLGKTLQEASEYLYETIQAPLAICCQSVLASANILVQGHADVKLPTGNINPISCYFISIAGSGERKTAVDKKALKVIYEKQKELIKNHKQENKQFENYNETKNLIMKDVALSKEEKEKSIEELGEEPEPPLYPLIICNEPTIQGFIKLLAKGQPSMGLFSDEGGSFVGGYSLSKENRTKSGADLSSLWDAKTIQYIRGGDGAIIVEGKRVSLHLMLQPEMAKNLLSDDVLKDQGLFGRFLVSFPEGKSGTRIYREVEDYDISKIEKYYTRSKEILDIPFCIEEGEQNVLSLEAIDLTKGAKELFIDFYNSVERDLGESRDYFFIKSLANKAPEYAVRLACTIALFEELKQENGEVILPSITEKYMQMGIDLSKYYLKEAVRMCDLLPQDRQLEKAKILLDWLINDWKEEHISISDAIVYGVYKFRSKKIIEPLLKKLEEYGYLIPNKKTVSIKGQKRRSTWRIKRG